MKKAFLLFLGFILLTGCALPVSSGAAGLAEQSSPSETAPAEPSATLAPTELPLPSETASPPPTETPTAQPTETATLEPSPTATFTATPQPVYRKLRAEVIIEQAVCHYGPGAPYLYKYGVYLGSHLEVLRRVSPGNYVELQAIGGNNPCWVKIDYLKLEDGTFEDLEPVSAADVPLPWSPYYPPLTGVSAQRSGSEVTVSWNALGLRAGDDSGQKPYIVEAWVCQQGQIVFIPAGSNQTTVKLTDEAGCSEPSRAWVTAAETHGYTRRVVVPWPAITP